MIFKANIDKDSGMDKDLFLDGEDMQFAAEGFESRIRTKYGNLSGDDSLQHCPRFSPIIDNS